MRRAQKYKPRVDRKRLRFEPRFVASAKASAARCLTLVSVTDTEFDRWAGMIKSFKNAETVAIFDGKIPRGFPAALVKVARRKLEAVNAAVNLEDLGSPPGNKLHRLTNDWRAQHAIWINSQYRVCFVWGGDGALDVEIVDYH
jgi:toxin HigB-1